MFYLLEKQVQSLQAIVTSLQAELKLLPHVGLSVQLTGLDILLNDVLTGTVDDLTHKVWFYLFIIIIIILPFGMFFINCVCMCV
jgi:hypothetical protein